MDVEKKSSAALYCYSNRDLRKVIEEMKWLKEPDQYVGIISICSSKWSDPEDGHYYPNGTARVLNIDFDDIDPEAWWKETHKEDRYDDLMNMYVLERKQNMSHKGSSEPFWTLGSKVYTDECPTNGSEAGILSNNITHALDFRQADIIERFIENCVQKNLNIYVHCDVGASRSQAVVRYILDTYPEVQWRTREANPCLTPNIHVVRMLKRAHIFNNVTNEDETLPPVEPTNIDDIWEPPLSIEPEVREDASTKEEYIIYNLHVKNQVFELRTADIIGLMMDTNNILNMSKDDIKNLKKK